MLQYSKYGRGEPLLILHGLFGSSKNWQTLARQFAEHFSVFSVDMRNHGDSFHDPVMSYEAMAGDIHSLVNHLGLERCHLIGHSMGGKAAMVFTHQYPQIVAKMVVADIAPLGYQHSHSQLIGPIMSIDLTDLKSRSEADNQLKADITDPMLRGFLLQNLVREGEFWRWKVNWSAIQQQMSELVRFPLDSNDWHIETPTLFVRGENSDYIDTDGLSAIERHFSQASVETIAKAGHWLHAEQPKQFLETVSDFLDKIT